MLKVKWHLGIRIFFTGILWTVASFASRVNIPVSDPIYEYLDRLEAFNCAYSTLRVFGPQTHQDLIAAVYVTEDQDRCEAPEWLLRERQILTRPLYALRVENRTVAVPDDFLLLSGTGGLISPVVPLREGRDTLGGVTSGTEILAQTGTQLSRVAIAAGVRPGWVGFIPEAVGMRGRFYLQEGYVKLGYGWSELTWGRVGLRFGQTKHGSLLFSGAAAPMDLIKYTLRPVVPGFAKFLGPVSVDAWWGRQDRRGLSQGANLAAIQLAMRPLHWLELGWAELFQFGGPLVPTMTLGDFARMALYLRDDRLDLRRSRSMATHLGIWFPKRTAKLYTQTLFSSLHSADDFSFLLGLWFPRVGSTQLRFEWVHTGQEPYHQSLFPNGLAYENSPLGHPLGPDGTGLYADFEFLLFDQWRVEVGAQYESRGPGNSIAGRAAERRWGTSLTARKRWFEMELEASVVFQNSRNAGYQPGVTQDSLGAATRFSYSFF
jgi:hypothetical protein